MRLEYCDKNEALGLGNVNVTDAMSMLVKYLKNNELTQREFSKMAGLDQSSLSKWIRGTTAPSEKTLEKIAKVTGLNFTKCVEKSVEVEDNTHEDTPVDICETPVEKCVKVKNLAGLRNKIRFGLQQKGVRQKDFAHILGLTETAYYKITHGNLDLPLDILEKMCEYLELSVEELVGEYIEAVKVVDDQIGTPLEEDLPWEDKVRETFEKTKEVIAEGNCEPIEDLSKFMTPYEEEIASEPVGEEEKIEEKPVEPCEVKSFAYRGKEIPPMTVNYKPANSNQRRVDELRKAAETIINNAESIVGSEISAGNMSINIVFNIGEVPRIHVERDIYF